VAGGAAAEPFRTHHKALGLELYLRIAPELYLKRLLVGGFNKVFELNRNFRNEGISRKHNPEFTMLEAYWAYADFEKIADLVEEMICHLAQTLEGRAPSRPTESGTGQSPSLQIEHRDAEGNVTRTINLTRPWRRARYRDLIREIDSEWFNYTSEKRRERCAELGVETNPRMADYEVTQQVFEKLVEELNPERSLSHAPLFQIMFALQNAPVGDLHFGGLQVRPWEFLGETAKFDLYLGLAQGPEGLRGNLEYATDLFQASSISRMIGHFVTLLESIVANPDMPVGELTLLSAAERQQLRRGTEKVQWRVVRLAR
jgi:lysyl-tRNA synthetase class II